MMNEPELYDADDALGRRALGLIAAAVILAGVVAIALSMSGTFTSEASPNTLLQTASGAATPPVSSTAATTTTAPSTTTTTPTTTVAPATTTPPTTEVPAPPTPPPAPDSVEFAGNISIPKLSLNAAMFDWEAEKGLDELDYGPGHWIGTAEPGEVGNMVIGGHRTSANHEFRYIDQLEPGDTIEITDESGATFTYAVRETLIVQPTDTWIVDPTVNPTVTLFACHPVGSIAERIVVFADLVA